MRHSPTACFPRSARLLRRAEYQYVFEQPVRVSDRYFSVLARANDGRGARLGLGISRRVAKAAVQRNRIKRLVRESFRHHRHALGDLDIVVLGRPAATAQDNPSLHAAMERHWARLIKRCNAAS